MTVSVRDNEERADGALDDQGQAGLPGEVDELLGVPSVKLVVQRSSAGDADEVGGAKGGDDVGAGDAGQPGGLTWMPPGASQDGLETAVRRTEAMEEDQEEAGVDGEQAGGERTAEEEGLGHKAPVDGPPVEKDAREVEGAAQVSAPVGEQEGETEQDLQGMSATSVQQEVGAPA